MRQEAHAEGWSPVPRIAACPSGQAAGNGCTSARIGTGRSEIWRLPFAGGPEEQVTRDGGYTGYESVDGEMLFYTKHFFGGPLFARRLPSGGEREVVPYIHMKSFFPGAHGIYYIGCQSDDKSYPLELFQFSDGSSRLLAKIDGSPYQGLSVSPDEKTILYSKSASIGADLMMIDNFR
jgi:hypothetical protein